MMKNVNEHASSSFISTDLYAECANTHGSIT